MSIEEAMAAALEKVLDRRLRPIEEQLRRLAPTDDLLDVSSAAALTGYSERTVRTRAKLGTLPGFKPKGSSEWRFRRSELLAALGPGAAAVDLETEARKIAGRR